MSKDLIEWDKLWKGTSYEHLLGLTDENAHPYLSHIKAVGDKLQRDLVFWQEACAEIQIYKDELYDKLQEMRNLTEEMDYGDDVEEHWRKRILGVLDDNSSNQSITKETE